MTFTPLAGLMQKFSESGLNYTGRLKAILEINKM